MSDKKPFEIEELDDKALEGVAGGSEMDLLPDIDAINCKDNTTCPNNGCSSGCSPNTVAGCT